MSLLAAHLKKGLLSRGGVHSECSVVSNSVTPWTVACQASLSMGLPRQEYWNGLPFPTPEDLPNQGSNPHLLWGDLQEDSLSLSQLGSPHPCSVLRSFIFSFNFRPPLIQKLGNT